MRIMGRWGRYWADERYGIVVVFVTAVLYLDRCGLLYLVARFYDTQSLNCYFATTDMGNANGNYGDYELSACSKLLLYY